LWFLQSWSRRVSALEEAIVRAPVKELPVLPETGQKELDRIVSALNRLNLKLKIPRRSARVEREPCEGRPAGRRGGMAAEVAHEMASILFWRWMPETGRLKTESILRPGVLKPEASEGAYGIESAGLGS